MEKGSEKKKHGYGCLVHGNKKAIKVAPGDEDPWDWDAPRPAFREAFRAAIRGEAPQEGPPAREGYPVVRIVREEPPRVNERDQDALDRMNAEFNRLMGRP